MRDLGLAQAEPVADGGDIGAQFEFPFGHDPTASTPVQGPLQNED
jgi:hypothetical protein